MKEKKRGVRWGLKDSRSVAWLIMILIGGFGSFAGWFFYFGLPMSWKGVNRHGKYVEFLEIAPRNPNMGIVAIICLFVFAIGLLVYAVTTVLIRRSEK